SSMFQFGTWTWTWTYGSFEPGADIAEMLAISWLAALSCANACWSALLPPPPELANSCEMAAALLETSQNGCGVDSIGGGGGGGGIEKVEVAPEEEVAAAAAAAAA